MSIISITITISISLTISIIKIIKIWPGELETRVKDRVRVAMVVWVRVCVTSQG